MTTRTTLTARRAGTDRRGGWALTEAALVLGVAAIVLGAIWTVGEEVWLHNKVMRFNQQVMTVARNVQNAYAPTGRSKLLTTSGAMITDSLRNDGLIPEDMFVSNKSASGTYIYRHAFGSNFAAQSFPPDIWLHFYHVPQSACIRILMEFPVLSPELGLKRFGTTVGYATINLKNITNPGGTITLPLTLAQASTWCADSTGYDGVEVYFDFAILQ